MTEKGSAIDRINRTALTFIGLVLAAAGAAGLALGSGLLGPARAGEPLADTLAQISEEAARWTRLAAFVVGMVLVYVCLRWVFAQVRLPSTARSLKVESGGRGKTEVRAGALENAISTNLKRLPGTAGARVRLLENGKSSNLDIRLEVEDDADVSKLLHEAGKVLPRTAGMVGMDDLNATIRLVPVRSQRVQ